jgi:octanoyl-[GcvH]:protein N-octanoyltransferase
MDGRGLEGPGGPKSSRTVQLLTEAFPTPPERDTAVSHALLRLVAVGAEPETLRIHRPGRVVAFGPLDRLAPGFAEAIAAASARGFGSVLRLAGGRAAVFHERTLAIAHARPDDEPQAHIYPRFEEWSGRIAEALRKVGLDARVGEVPGEYCPGGYSVNARGAIKLAGIGQKLIKGAGHLGGVVVVGEADRIRNVLVPVYDALGLDFEPATAGAVDDDLPSVSMDEVEEALTAELSSRYELTEEPLDPETLEFAKRLAPEHVAPATSSSSP